MTIYASRAGAAAVSRRCRSTQVYDLLDPRPRKDKERSGGLQIKEHPVLGIHVQGLQQIVANCVEIKRCVGCTGIAAPSRMRRVDGVNAR